MQLAMFSGYGWASIAYCGILPGHRVMKAIAPLVHSPPSRAGMDTPTTNKAVIRESKD